MRVTRTVAGLIAAITAVLGLSVATASPAAAADGVWRPYGNTNPITSSNSEWGCGPSREISTGVTNVFAQACAVRSVDGVTVQSAVIVRNMRSHVYSVTVTMSLWANVWRGDWTCALSGVAPNSWSVCFGQSRIEGNSAFTTAKANGLNLTDSPLV